MATALDLLNEPEIDPNDIGDVLDLIAQSEDERSYDLTSKIISEALAERSTAYRTALLFRTEALVHMATERPTLGGFARRGSSHGEFLVEGAAIVAAAQVRLVEAGPEVLAFDPIEFERATLLAAEVRGSG